MNNILIIVVVEIFNLLFIYFTTKAKSKSSDIKEKNEISINPVKIYKKAKENKKIEEENKKEREELKIMLENIENYNGTGLGQKDIL